jgi:formylglycine-generating enzyme required for sulfatase activity
MTLASVAAFVHSLRQSRLLEPDQLEEISQLLQNRFPNPRALAKELIDRDWLTPYQVNQLFQGRGSDLVLGQYTLLERLGEGGMGKVFKARHRTMGRIVAMKLIRKERLSNPDVIRRFHREVQAAAQLKHPNVVHAFDADQLGGTHFIVMEYIEGIDLSRWLKNRGPLPVEQACDYIRQAALGLQHAFERGLVHRDIKPGNLLVSGAGSKIEERGSRTEDRASKVGPARSSTLDPRSSNSPWGVVKILDMGLARLHTDAEGEWSTGLTQEGAVVGTVDYLAPEQAMNASTVDIRADIYSLGCSFYHLLTGQPPFPGTTAVEKLLRHRCDEAVPVNEVRPQVTPALAGVVRRMMAKQPEDRLQTPAAVAAALAALIEQGELTRTAAEPGIKSVAVPGPTPPPARILTDADGLQETTGPWDGLAFSPSTEEEPRPPRPRADRRRRTWLRFWPVAAGLAVGLVLLLLLWPGQSPRRGATTAGDKQGFAREITNSIGMRLVWVPPGSFLMGSPGTEPGRGQEEGPLHEVTISQGFYLGQYEVTQAEYARVMNHNPALFRAGSGGGPNYPVEQVTWTFATDFCRYLSGRDAERRAGRTYRLPTEAEWEYACRAGSKAAYSFGEDPTMAAEHAWLGTNSGKATHVVGTKKPNAWGLYDMHGNVAEWCADYHGADYYSQSPTRDPQGPIEGLPRVVRGGSWADDVVGCRSARRQGQAPQTANGQIGFRVVMTLHRSGK